MMMAGGRILTVNQRPAWLDYLSSSLPVHRKSPDKKLGGKKVAVTVISKEGIDAHRPSCCDHDPRFHKTERATAKAAADQTNLLLRSSRGLLLPLQQ